MGNVNMLNTPRMVRASIVVFLMGVSSSVMCMRAVGFEGPPPTLNPKTYVSPSGKCSLFVDPGDLHGRNGGSYRLTHDGKDVWSGSRPYTLWDAFVTDDGVTGGYSYSHGWRGYSEAGFKAGFGDFRVVIIDASGKERLEQITKREPSRFLHTPPNPLGGSLLVDVANDRLVVRVRDADLNRGAEEWWTYRLSTGMPGARFRPKELMSGGNEGGFLDTPFINDVKFVAGTPLTLLHWWRYRLGDHRPSDARFTLIDLDGKPVWSHELPGDYPESDDNGAVNGQRRALNESGAILKNARAGQFDLWFFKAASRVTFAVKQRPNGEWTVTEVGRRAYVAAVPIEPKEPEIPVLAIPWLGRVELKVSADGPPADIRGVGGIAFDDRGRIAFLRDASGKTPSLVVIDQLGRVLRTIALDGTRSEDERGWCNLTWVGKERYLLLRDSTANGRTMDAWWVDAALGKASQVPGFSTSALSEAAGFPDGRFVVKGGLHYSRHSATGDDNLYAFDAKGGRAWTLEQGDHTDPAALFDLKSVAITTDGRIAVLDNIRGFIQFFAADGKHLRTVEVAKAWRRNPSYLTTLAADRDGGLLVSDFEGTPPLVRMAADGRVRAGIQPSYPDGHKLGIRDAQVAPDGSVWVTDGYALLRLGESGAADRVLGDGPDNRRLGRIAAVTIDFQGRIYAAAARTGAVHVFERDGRWLRVCSPAPADVPEGLSRPQLTVSTAGDVYEGLDTTGDGPYIHFSPEGKRLGIESLKLNDVKEVWYCQPGTGRRWVIGYEKMFLADSAGKVVRTITRRPDRHWLDKPGDAAVAPDGSIAVESGGAVSLYRADGEPIRTFALPSSMPSRFPRLAFNGERVVVVADKSVFVFDAFGKALGQFSPPKGQDESWTPFLRNRHRDLLLFNGKNVIYQFKLP